MSLYNGKWWGQNYVGITSLWIQSLLDLSLAGRISNPIFSPELSFQVVGSGNGVGEVRTNECWALSLVSTILCPEFWAQSEGFLLQQMMILGLAPHWPAQPARQPVADTLYWSRFSISISSTGLSTSAFRNFSPDHNPVWLLKSLLRSIDIQIHLENFSCKMHLYHYQLKQLLNHQTLR